MSACRSQDWDIIRKLRAQSDFHGRTPCEHPSAHLFRILALSLARGLLLARDGGTQVMLFSALIETDDEIEKYQNSPNKRLALSFERVVHIHGCARTDS